ncbi:MAG: T9SS type A sorting domain-containing protein [Ignavibacteriota bacterium]
MKRAFLIFFILIFTTFGVTPFAYSQPGISWQRSLGGQDAVAIREIPSGGYITAGNYWGGYPPDPKSCNNGDSSAAWAAKLDGNGKTIWQRCYSGNGQNLVHSIIPTKDQGFIFCGGTSANVGEGSVYHGMLDAWVMKLDSEGNIEWQKTYGGADYDVATSIIQTFDGNYAFGGWTRSNDGDVSGNHGADDEWVVKIGTTGKIDWQKCLGGSSYDRGSYLIESADSGIIVTGSATSNDGNVGGNHGQQEMWIVKLRRDTTIAWQTCAGGISDDGGAAICRLSNGRYLAIGSSQSYFLNDDYHGGNDFYAVWIDDSGKVSKQFCYGGSRDDGAVAVSPTADGGFLLGGTTNSSDGDLSGRSGSFFQDAWVVKCDSAGSIEWQKSLGGRWDETANSVLQISEGEYIFAGQTSSSDGDVASNYFGGSAWNSWIVKLSDNAGVADLHEEHLSNLKIIPNPSSTGLYISYTSGSQKKSELDIYDVLGKLVESLPDEGARSGEHQLKIDVRNLHEGSYNLRLRSGGESLSGKFTVIRKD